LTLNNQEIAEYVESLEKESKALIKQLYTLAWHMRGGMTLDEAFQISFSDREIVMELIKEHMEVTKESHLPYF
jgi:hypothetical protein